MILFLKGIVIGLGKIIPGISGSLLAIFLNVYDESIERISHPFSDLKNNIIYFSLLGSGIIVSIILMSKIILFFMSHFFCYTMLTILGLIMGVLPSFCKKIVITKRQIIYLILPFIFLTLINNSNGGINFFENLNYFKIGIIGFLESLTTIIPGISGTAIYLLLGCYEFVLNLFINPFSYQFFCFFIGMIIGVIIISKILNYCLKKYKNELNMVVLSLTIFSSASIVKEIFSHNITLFNLLFGIILFFIGFLISKKFDI